MREIDTLAVEFSSCRKILQALGDETRQLMILQMMKAGNCHGVSVCEITEKHTFPAHPYPIICGFSKKRD